MSKNKTIMSENLKEKIAKELGVYETVKNSRLISNIDSNFIY